MINNLEYEYGSPQQATPLQKWADLELQYLWHDLDDALMSAYNGVWSIGCENIVLRILTGTAVLPPVAPEFVPWRLFRGGLYKALYGLVGIEDNTDIHVFDELMAEYEVPDFTKTITAMENWWEVERKHHAL